MPFLFHTQTAFGVPDPPSLFRIGPLTGAVERELYGPLSVHAWSDIEFSDEYVAEFAAAGAGKTLVPMMSARGPYGLQYNRAAAQHQEESPPPWHDLPSDSEPAHAMLGINFAKIDANAHYLISLAYAMDALRNGVGELVNTLKPFGTEQNFFAAAARRYQVFFDKLERHSKIMNLLAETIRDATKSTCQLEELANQPGMTPMAFFHDHYSALAEQALREGDPLALQKKLVEAYTPSVRHIRWAMSNAARQLVENLLAYLHGGLSSPTFNPVETELVEDIPFVEEGLYPRMAQLCGPESSQWWSPFSVCETTVVDEAPAAPGVRYPDAASRRWLERRAREISMSMVMLEDYARNNQDNLEAHFGNLWRFPELSDYGKRLQDHRDALYVDLEFGRHQAEELEAAIVQGLADMQRVDHENSSELAHP